MVFHLMMQNKLLLMQRNVDDHATPCNTFPFVAPHPSTTYHLFCASLASLCLFVCAIESNARVQLIHICMPCRHGLQSQSPKYPRFFSVAPK